MPGYCDNTAMLTEIYIEALLVDEEAADAVWEAWYAGGSAISGQPTSGSG